MNKMSTSHLQIIAKFLNRLSLLTSNWNESNWNSIVNFTDPRKINFQSRFIYSFSGEMHGSNLRNFLYILSAYSINIVFIYSPSFSSEVDSFHHLRKLLYTQRVWHGNFWLVFTSYRFSSSKENFPNRMLKNDLRMVNFT